MRHFLLAPLPVLALPVGVPPVRKPRRPVPAPSRPDAVAPRRRRARLRAVPV